MLKISLFAQTKLTVGNFFDMVPSSLVQDLQSEADTITQCGKTKKFTLT